MTTKRDDEIFQAIKGSNFKEKYESLCLAYPNPDLTIRLNKKDVDKIVLSNFTGAQYDSRSKIFFIDKIISPYEIRLCIPFSYGTVGPWYTFQIPNEKYRYYGSFNTMSNSDESLHRGFVPARSPCIHSSSQIEPIFSELARIHYDFYENFQLLLQDI